jgi:hypothetical protein
MKKRALVIIHESTHGDEVFERPRKIYHLNKINLITKHVTHKSDPANSTPARSERIQLIRTQSSKHLLQFLSLCAFGVLHNYSKLIEPQQ